MFLTTAYLCSESTVTNLDLSNQVEAIISQTFVMQQSPLSRFLNEHELILPQAASIVHCFEKILKNVHIVSKDTKMVQSALVMQTL